MRRIAVWLSLAGLMTIPATGWGAGIKGACSFRKSLKQGATTFEVSSRAGDGCAVQIISIAALRGGKPYARFKADVDYLAREVWSSDLDGDGKPELIVASAAVGSAGYGAVDVYYFEGSLLRRVSLPEMLPEEREGYRGHDSFRLEKGQIVRSFPVFDRDGSRPGGTTRSLRYEYDKGVLAVVRAPEAPAVPPPAPAVSEQRVVPEPARPPQVEPQPATSPVAANVPAPAPEAAVEAKATSVEAKAAPPVVADQGTPAPVAVPAAAAAPAEQKPSSPPAADKPAVSAAPSADVAKAEVVDVVAGPHRIDILTSAPPAGISQKKLFRPGRLTISMAGARTKVALRRTGLLPQVARVDVENAADGVAIVVESSRPAFPVHTLSVSESGVRIEFPADDTPTPPVPSESAAAPVSPPAEPRPAVSGRSAALKITGITADDGGILIRTSGAAAAFKTLKLDKPERLAVDVSGVVSALQKNSVAIGRLGIGKVRIGRNQGFVRIVLDAAGHSLPKYAVSAVDEGIRIALTPAEPTAIPQSGQPPAEARSAATGTVPASSAPSPAAAAQVPVITGIIPGDSFIDIQAEAPISRFKHFRLTKPDRLVIDLPAGTTRIQGQSVTIGRFGIGKARIGRNKVFLRIVLEASQGELPECTVTTTEGGLRVSVTH